jgi:GH35 family endo-1,4-beta-xylanase
MRSLRSATLALLLAAGLVHPVVAGKGLRDFAAGPGLFVGTAVRFYQRDPVTGSLMSPFRDDGVYRARIAKEFNLVTPENVMKMDTIHPAPDQYNFSDGDQLVDFAEQNGIAVRGHVLVWHSQLPSWFANGNFTQAEVQQILQEHIQHILGHYQGRIFAWDVVNEAIDDFTHKLRDSPWLRAGNDYIEQAFKAARQADPDAVLCYNDYNHADSEGWQKAKSDAVYKMVKKLVKRKVPIDCVGFQFHIDTSFSPIAIAENFKRYADLGLQVQITELDVRLPVPADSAALKQQAATYKQVLDLCLGAPNCTALVTWGYTDRYSWIPQFVPGYGAALPLDENFKKKPAYRKIAKGLKKAAPQN